MSGTTLGCARDARRLGMFSWVRAIPGAATNSCAGFNKTDSEPDPRFFKPVTLSHSNSYSAYYCPYFLYLKFSEALLFTHYLHEIDPPFKS